MTAQFHDLLIRFEYGTPVSVSRAGDTAELDAALRLFKPGDRILHGGCGTGETALVLSAVFGADRVESYEPNRALVHQARNTCQIDGRKIRVWWGGLWHRDGVMGFDPMGDFWAAGHLTADQNPPDVVPVFDVGRLARQHGFTALLLDVEGAEAAILSRCDLTPVHRLVVEIHGNADEASDLIRHQGFAVLAEHAHPSLGYVVLAAERPTRG